MADYWENFPIEFKDKDRKQISLYSTLCNMPGELLLKVAIDMGWGRNARLYTFDTDISQ